MRSPNRIRVDTYYQSRYIIQKMPWGVNVWRGRELLARGYGSTEREAIADARSNMRRPKPNA